MKVSLNYIKKYLNFKLPEINQIADKVGTQLGALETDPIYLGDIYKDIYIIKVISAQPISGSDHLSFCKIDDGGVLKKLDNLRDKMGYIDVVCGAPNVIDNCLAIYIPPGTVVPSSYNKEKFVIESKVIMGHNSHGMLASAMELNLGSDHSGIVILNQKITPGTKLIDYLDLDDYIFDIENKMFTHRPDCFGLIGVSREISGIFDQAFKSPIWYLNTELNPKIKKVNNFKLKLNIEDGNLINRFCGVIIQNIKIKPSPIKIQSYLSRMGIRPINNIVDITNLVMLETGQPLHAYDLNKLKTKDGILELSAKLASKNQKINLINNKEIKLTENDLIIENNQRPVALAGIMGGLESEIDNQTTGIVIESANFDMFLVRKSSMNHGIFSDSLTRFNKGQSPFQCLMALIRAINLIYEDDPGVIIASNIEDNNQIKKEYKLRGTVSNIIHVSYHKINQILGSDLSKSTIQKLLTNVQFDVSSQGDNLSIKPPYWRTDILIDEDIVEEVGRLLGYHQIKIKSVIKEIKPANKNQFLEFKDKIREILKIAGSNEVLTHSFVSKKLIDAANQDASLAYQIANSISPELEHYRLSLSPSLVSSIYKNIRAGNDCFSLFELGVAHNHEFQNDFEQETKILCFSYSSKNELDGAAFYKSKHFLNYLILELGINQLKFKVLAEFINEVDKELDQIIKPFNEIRSALIFNKDDQCIGVIGEYKDNFLNALKAPQYSSGFELLLDRLYQTEKVNEYQILSKYPSIKKDITIPVSSSTTYDHLRLNLDNFFYEIIDSDIDLKISPLSIFKKEEGSPVKNISFSLEFNSKIRTLKEELIKEYFEKFTKLSGYDLI